MTNKAHPGDVIAEAMREQNLSANELARRSGVPQPTITRIINKQSSDPENATLGKIARALGKTVAQLRGEAPNLVEEGKPLYAVPNVKPAPPLKPVPMVSWEQLKQSLQSPKKAAAKNWGGESFMPMYTTRSVSRNAFALKLSDDTMESPQGSPSFPKGCTIVADPDVTAENGSYIIYSIAPHNELTFKQLVRDAGRDMLKPLNSRYPIIEKPEGKIVAVVVQLIMDF